MNPADEVHDQQLESQLLELLGHYEEQLLAGSTDGADDWDSAPQQLRPHFDRARAVLQLLAQQGPSDPWLNQLAETDLGSATAAPRRVDRFEILRELGHGGCGIVFLAYDPYLRREVALKIPLSGAFVTKPMRDRFLQEAWAAAGLDHPNVVPVFETGQDGFACFIVSAYCSGPSLADWMNEQRDPVPERLAAELLAQIADGVEHAHGRGVLHRDLKPSNVMLDPDDDIGTESSKSALRFVPRITDFGLAKLQEEGIEQTQSGVLVGTASYMAPEQAAGMTRIDARADVYALGAILYELLIGRPPFVGETQLDTLEQVKRDEAVPPSRLRPKVALDLETICLKCLEKEPTRRYGSAALLRQDLGRFLAGQPILARPISRWAHLGRWCARNPVFSILGATVAGLILALLLTFMMMSLWLNNERVNTLRAMGEMHVAQAESLRRSGRMGQRSDSLTSIQHAVRIAETTGFEDTIRSQLRSDAIEALVLPDLVLVTEHRRPGSDALPVAFSPTLEFYACPDGDGRLFLYRTDSGQVAGSSTYEGGSISQMRFSPDGERLASLHQNDEGASIQLWEWRQSMSVHWKALGVRKAAFDFSADGQLLAAIKSDGSIGLYNTATGTESKSLQIDLSADGCCFSPDATELAVWEQSVLHVFDVQSGAALFTFPHASSAIIQTVAWSPGGDLLATGCSNFRAYVWDVQYSTETPLRTLVAHESWIRTISFDKEGDLLLTSGSDRKVCMWDRWDGQLVAAGSGQLGRLSSDGQFAGGLLGDRVVRWRLETGGELRSLHHPSDYETQNADISPDGSLLVSCASNGLRLWDFSKGQQIARLSMGDTCQSLFDSGGTSVFTFGSDGLQRCYIQREPASGEVQLLRGRKMHPRQPDRADFVSLSGDRRIVVTAHGDQLQVFQLDDPAAQERVIQHDGLRMATASSQGNWVATVGGAGRTIKIWDASTAHELYAIQSEVELTSLAFDPQDKRIVAAGHTDYWLWEVGSTEPVGHFKTSDYNWPRAIAFTPNGRLLAIVSGDFQVDLVDTVNPKLIAGLRIRQQYPWLFFSPDADRLICSGTDTTIEVWDLRRIRDGLLRLGLDWE